MDLVSVLVLVMSLGLHTGADSATASYTEDHGDSGNYRRFPRQLRRQRGSQCRRLLSSTCASHRHTGALLGPLWGKALVQAKIQLEQELAQLEWEQRRELSAQRREFLRLWELAQPCAPL